MEPVVEILVHASAPCGLADDAKHRWFAQSFLDTFAGPPSSSNDPYATADISPQEAAPITADVAGKPEARSRCGRGPNDSDYGEAAEAAVCLHESDRDGPKASSIAQTPLRPLPSRRPQQAPLTCIRETPIAVRAESEPTPAAADTHTDHRRSQSDSFDAPPSEVPDSQPSDSATRKRRREQSPSHVIPMLEAAVGAASSPAGNKRQKRAPDPSSSQMPTSDRSLPPMPATSPTSHKTASTPGRGRTRTIQPPPPPTSISTFSTYATQPLRLFASNGKLAACYAPTALRAVRPLERGHWSLRIDRVVWTLEAVRKFWAFVKAFIKEGRAGWATWAEREPAGDAEAIRVWCWGELVQEVWLMLFVGSDRLVKKAGAVWIDAEGQAALRMDAS